MHHLLAQLNGNLYKGDEILAFIQNTGNYGFQSKITGFKLQTHISQTSVSLYLCFCYEMCPAVQWTLKDIQVLNGFLLLLCSTLRQKLSEEHVQAFNYCNLQQEMGTGESTNHCVKVQFTQITGK